MDLRTWRGRLWFGLTVGLSTAFVRLIGPTYISPLPMWLQLGLAVVGCCVIAAAAIYSRRRARRANSL